MAHPVSRVKLRSFIIAVCVSGMIALGLSVIPLEHTASVMISFDPGEIADEWDVLKDQTRDIDFEEQVASRAVLAPVIRDFDTVDTAPGILQRLGMGSLPSDDRLTPEQISENAINSFRKRLLVERIRNSSVLRITVTMASSQAASRAANAVAASFINFKRRQSLNQSAKRLNAIEQETSAIQRDLFEAMGKRNAFLKEHGWNDYSVELAAARSRVSEIKQAIAQFDSYTGAGRYVGTGVDENLKNLIAKANEIETRYVQTKSRFKENSPPMLQISREKEALGAAIAEYVSSSRDVLKTKLAVEQEHIQELLDVGPDMETCQAAIDHAQKRFQSLLDERSAARLLMSAAKEKTSGFGKLQVLDEAVASAEDSRLPGIKRIVFHTAAAFVITLCLSMIAFELWNQVVIYSAHQRSVPVRSVEKPI